MATRHPHTGAPHRLHSLFEWRALLEMALLPFTWPLLATAQRGDGHPVLLLPGFMGDEITLVGIKTYLQGRGYDVQTWGLGRNIGFQRRHAQALEQKIRHLHHSTGRKVSLVGWSLGGVFALYGAHQAAECVRQVITLGSPVNVDAAGSQSPPLVKALYRLIAHPMGPAAHVMQPRAKKLREHHLPGVPMSCLYSISDGVVPPQEATLDAAADTPCENIRVAGSHTGLGFNPMVLCILADRHRRPDLALEVEGRPAALGHPAGSKQGVGWHPSLVRARRVPSPAAQRDRRLHSGQAGLGRAGVEARENAGHFACRANAPTAINPDAPRQATEKMAALRLPYEDETPAAAGRKVQKVSLINIFVWRG